MSTITNRIIGFNDHIDTYSYSGTIGDCGAFSVHPLKNLNACGMVVL